LSVTCGRPVVFSWYSKFDYNGSYFNVTFIPMKFDYNGSYFNVTFIPALFDYNGSSEEKGLELWWFVEI
jgi:hypothetical protein